MKMSKYHDIDDIRYILKEYPDEMPEELIRDFYYAIIDHLPNEEESK